MFRHRVFYILTLSAAALFYLFYTGYLSFFLLALLLLLPAVSWVLTFFAVRKTSVRMEPESPYAVKGEAFLLRISVKNSSFLPIAQARLRFGCENSLCGERRQETLFLPVGTGPEQTAEYRMVSGYCGKITAELNQITFYDYLGIFSITRKPELRAEMFAAPRALYPDALFDNTGNPGLESSTYSKVKPGDDPSEIFDIRPYRSGDRPRSIHWKLSSRLDELMVKEFSLPTDSSVLLLTELMAADMDALDTVVETAASVSRFLLENEIVHSVGWYGNEQKEYFETRIENGEDEAVLVNALLSARRYRDSPLALTCGADGLSGKYPHLIYITGTLTKELNAFCGAQESTGKITILHCGNSDEPQRELAEELTAMQAEVIEIPAGTAQESLSGIAL